MHILIAILGAVAAAFWAFTHFVNAANQGTDAVREVKGVIRRGKWNRRVDQRLIENLSDPREAAAILLYQIAAYDGAVTDRQKSVMMREMRDGLSADEDTAEGLYAFARMASGEINDAANNLKKILKPVLGVCTDEEKSRLLAMMATISEAESPCTDMQKQLIESARHILLPPK